tara:strand:- start:2136 stop:2369 length:234 start_codon:yes stop_codon:yes gene_type:complete
MDSVKYLVLLLLSFDGEMIKERLEFERPVTVMECSEFAEEHRDAISVHKWFEGKDIMKSGYYLKDGRGTFQGYICTN